MLAKLKSVALTGIDAQLLQIEVDISSGIPGMTIVGLPDAAVKEAKDRVKAAINNSHYQFPFKKMTVNLAPADIRKEGPCYDLPIAIGTLMASGALPHDQCPPYALVGELSLEGELRPVRGALSMAIAAKEKGMTGIVLPQANASEASVVEGIEVIPAVDLQQAVGFIAGDNLIEPVRAPFHLTWEPSISEDFREVVGQESVKRALLVAAAGAHNLLMIGPPGSGKTMMARCLPGILPPLTLEESLETTRIYSVSGQLKAGSSLLKERPFRSPHHTISDVGLIGGGARPRPGEISLSHHGILFLDEFPEFKRNVLEVLRQPLEEGSVIISRAHSSVTYPSRFMLVGSMNPCPCGYFGDLNRSCRCTPSQIERYIGRLSGPLLDRIDLHVEVEAVSPQLLKKTSQGASTSQLRQEVLQARQRQYQRFKDDKILSNAEMTPRHLKKYCGLGGEAENLLMESIKKMGHSTRVYHRLLKVARTLADLEGVDQISLSHVAEALGFRALDRRLWMS